MKFMTRLRCLMGGNNVVRFQDSSTSTHVQSTISLDHHKSNNIVVAKKKKKKIKTKKNRKVIKVFTPDGEINLYHKPIMVSEVLRDECMVCRSDSFYIGQKIPPLSQHDRLQPGHTYFLLPAHLFHSVLSFVTIASFTSSCKLEQQDTLKMKAAFLKKAAASSPSPFDIQKSPSGTLRIRVSELFISQLMMDQAAGSSTHDQAQDDGLLCTTPQLLKDYKQLVVESRRGWKPKLEMIKETPLKGKRKAKMLLSASISRMKRKMKKNKSLQVSSSFNSSASASASALKKRKKKTKTKTKKSIKPPSLKANKSPKTGA
ncbi:uncharacterized protein LOC143579869 [Bidens hawaiensis]|uniref:uncharacterized protein LOC143579869 n=1 Tax=Bidens hawaiensis TaxID=980011 RepID=UPI00404AF344